MTGVICDVRDCPDCGSVLWHQPFDHFCRHRCPNRLCPHAMGLRATKQAQNRLRMVARLEARDGRGCFYCHAVLTDPMLYTFDHYQPTSKGGAKGFKNLRLSCWQCNHDKGDQVPVEATVGRAEQ